MDKPRHMILGSASPRRRELLARAGFCFEVITADTDETADGIDEPADFAEAIALKKAAAVSRICADDSFVIGADTVVVLDRTILGKPADDEVAFDMLSHLSGRTHQVITGVAFVFEGHHHVFHETTAVTFHDLSEKQIRDYIATREPADKAGAYGIQGLGAALVSSWEGDFDNVVGLPVQRLEREIDAFGSL